MTIAVSIEIDSNAAYPPADVTSPDSPPPEYPFAHNSETRGSRIYSLVRDCLAQSQADAANFGTASWNPLGEVIKRGDRVTMLPNLVMHRRNDRGERASDFLGKCTHGSVLRAICDYVLIAAGGPERVSIACAPLQSCDFGKVLDETGTRSMTEFYRQVAGIHLPVQDLRGVHTSWSPIGALLATHERPDQDWVSIDLGASSLLDELYTANGPSRVDFRVGDYDAAETLAYHAPGRHVYTLSRAVLESDVVVSVPKLKTHEKVGVTCALKGTVGTIARKECLAHYRLGSPEDGGDEYPAASHIRSLISNLVDTSAGEGTGLWRNLHRVGAKGASKLSQLGPSGVMNGAWHGNDTAWRMTLDIARIVRYGRLDGSMAQTPQRQHLVLVDGIVGGDGQGPLRPRACHRGLVLFAWNPVHSDRACAMIMGFDPDRIPLLRSALSLDHYPLVEESDSPTIVVNGQRASDRDLIRMGNARPFLPPKGWRDHLLELPRD